MKNAYEVIEEQTGQEATATTPLDELHIDSLEFLDLLLALDNETGKTVPYSRLAEFHTVGDLVEALA